MSLSYLSGDIDELVVVGKRSRPSQQKRQQKKEVNQVKKADKKSNNTMRKKGSITTKKVQGKKRTVKGRLKDMKGKGFIKKKIAKVGLAPARAAFLTVVTLNGAKLATKLLRVYRKDGGKEKILEFWSKFGGNADKLKDAIRKGSKEQINGDSVGVAIAAALATAAPIIVALIPIIKQFKAEGDAKEAKEFDSDIINAKKDLSAGNVDGATISEAAMKAESETGVITAAKKSEIEGGGEGEKEDTTMGSFSSPLGAFFKFPLMISILYPLFQNSPLLVILLGIIQAYCFIGFVLFPFTELNFFGLKKYTEFYNQPCYTILNFKNYVRRKQTI